MRRSFFLSIFMLIFVILSGCGEKKSAPQLKTHQISQEELGKDAVCPVCGMKIAVSSHTPALEYKGKIYYFCTEGEKGQFMKDPEKSPANEMEKEKVVMEPEKEIEISEEEMKALGSEVHKIGPEEIDKIVLCPGCQKYLAVSSLTPAVKKDDEIFYFCSEDCMGTFLRRHK